MKLHLSASLLCAALGAWAAAPAQAANKTVTDAQTTTTIEESYGNITVGGGSASLTVSEGGSLTATGMTEMKNGGSIIIDGGSLTTNKLMLHNQATNTAEYFTLKSGTVTVTGTNKTLPGASSGGQNAVVIGHWGNGNNNTKLSIEGGTFNALDGLVVVSWTSPGKLDISGGTANMYGISIAGQPDVNKDSTLNLSGTGVLNLGAGGLQSKASSSSKTVNLNGGTLGVLDSNWNADSNVKMNLGGNVTVNTERTVAGTGEGQAVGSGATVTFQGTISGSGSMEKTGEGALVISGTVSGSGKTFIATAGTLDFAGSSLASGNTFQLNGGEIANLTLQLGNTLTQKAGTSGTLSNLTLSGGTVSFSGLNASSYSLTGTLTLGVLTTFDFSGSTGYADGTVLFSGVTFGEGFTWNDDEWARYFTLTGTAENWKIVYDQTSNALKLAANTAAQLTWDNAAGTGAWNTTDANWGDASTTFRTGDFVTFSGTTGTVTVDGAGVLASKVTIAGASGFVLAGGMVTAPVNIEGASSLTVDNTVAGAVSLSGASTLTVGTGTLDGIVTFGDAVSRLVLTKPNAFSSTATVAGSGIVEVNWGTQSGNVNAQLGAFDGTLQITSGRYDAGSAPLAAAGIVVKDGGQFHITGGTWSQEFTISGNGLATAPGIAEAGNADSGALRFENGTISGKVTLDGNATVMVHNGTGTFSGAIVGSADSTLTKKGAGTLTISNTNLSNLNLTIAEGIVTFAQEKTYNLGTVTVKEGATLQDQWKNRLNITQLVMENGSYLDLNNGGANSDPTLTFATMKLTGTAHIKNQSHGTLNIAGKIVGEGGTLHFTTGNGTNILNINSEMSGTLDITKDVASTLNITNANNTYEGNMNVSAGVINVSGGINGANNTYAASGDGTLTVSGANGNIRNTAVTVKRNGSTDATINHATVGTSSISKETAATQGSVVNAAIDISATAYAVEGVALSDSLVNLKAAGSLTLTNVTLTGTTKLAGDAAVSGTKTVHFSGSGNSLTMPAGATGTGHDTFNTGATTLTSVYVYDISSHFSDVTLTGHLALDVSALLGTLPGSYDYVAFDFGTANNVVLDESLTVSVTPNAYNSGELAGTVSGHVVYFDTKSVPEPASAGLALLGFSGLLLRRRRRGV